MFTESDLKALVPRKIFERGSAYYCEDDAVGRIRRSGDTFKAKVQGTETYRVELIIRPGKLPKIYCDCPYDYGDVCKHGIALGLAVLDLLSDEEGGEFPAPAPLTAKERLPRLLQAAWSRISDKEKLSFLRQQMAQKPKLLRRFLAAFEFDEAALLVADAREKPSPRPLPAHRSAPPPPLPRRSPPPRRPLTFLEQVHQLIKLKKNQELLPLLLTVDWLRVPSGHNPHVWTYFLVESAGAQPESTFDAVMERFEAYLEKKELRGRALYDYISACLRALGQVPELTKQVQLFASELMQQYRRLSSLRQGLAKAGFSQIENELATDLLPKQRGRQPKTPGG